MSKQSVPLMTKTGGIDMAALSIIGTVLSIAATIIIAGVGLVIFGSIAWDELRKPSAK